jgi:hypothetical protein
MKFTNVIAASYNNIIHNTKTTLLIGIRLK